MDLAFSDEQEELRRQVRRVLSANCNYAHLRRMINEDVSFDEALWSKAAELGWLGVTIPEEYGGLGLGAEELCIISEEIGRALAPIPFSSSTCLAAEAIRLYGSDEQCTAYLPALASGKLIAAMAVSEGPSWDLDAPATTIAAGRITGRKLPVADGTIADLLITTARDEDGVLRLLLVSADQPSVTRTRVRGIDELRHHAVVEFNRADTEPLQMNAGAEEALARLYNGAAVYTAFEQVGGADVCLDMAKSYSMERKTFGRLIGSYQALKHRMADMFAKTELARSNAFGGAWALSNEKDELSMLAAVARISANDALMFAATENLQIHGGIGYTFEGNCHFYFRRARLLSTSLGATAAWSDRVVDGLLQGKGI